MTIDYQEPVYKQIRNLLMVLLIGVAAAGVMAGFFLLNFNPTGLYKIDQVLLSPTMVKSLDFSDQNPLTGKVSHYIFDKFEFNYRKNSSIESVIIPISLDTYKKMYQIINSDLSLNQVSEDIIKQFYNHNSKLTLFVSQSGSHSPLDSKTFQEVQFSNKGNYYRIDLHDQNKGQTWIYFHHQDIMTKLMPFIKRDTHD